jgi:hypothetical protein
VEIQMRRSFLTTLLLATTLLAGCGSDTSTGPRQTIVGTWSLQSINGAALPYVAQTDVGTIEILGDRIVVSADGTFTDALVVRVTSNTNVVTSTINDTGNYTVNGTAVEFVFASDNTSGTAALSGDNFTFADGGVSWAYQRE